jgi:O-antigen/teichoic acid export membrane protein
MWRLWSVYGLTSILGRSIAFVLLPIYTSVLTPHEYGIRAMVGLALDLTGLLFAFGLKEAINRFYAGGDDPAARRAAMSTGILLHDALIGVGVVAAIAAAPALSALLLGDAALASYLRLGLVGAFFMHAQEATFVYLRARQRAATVAVASIAGLLAMVAFNLLFVVAFRWGVVGIFYAEIIVYGIGALWLTVRALRETGVRFVPDLAHRMVRFGAPVMVMPFAWLAMSRIDIMFLTHYGSLAAVGVYALALQCAQVLQVGVVSPFRNYWNPAQFEVAAEPAGSHVYRRMFQWFTFTAVVAGFACAVAADDVIAAMAAPPFHGAAAVVPLLLVGHVLEGVHMFVNTALLARNRTPLLGVVALLTAGVNIAANAVLVPHFLAVGAAVARIAAMTAMTAVTYVLARRLWAQRPDFVALAKTTGGALALFALSRALPELPPMLALGTDALLVAVLIAFSVWSGAVDRADVTHAWRAARGRVRRAGAVAVAP